MGGLVSRDRLVVRTLRCGRSNPDSNPGPGISFLNSFHLPSCKKPVDLNIIFSLYLGIFRNITKDSFFT